MDQLIIINPIACGMGQGAECCAYLMAGDKGTECGRVNGAAPMIRKRVEAGTFTAQRLPTEDFPDCQRPKVDAQ